MTIEKINSRASLDRSPKENWVDRAGGLPMYIRRIANHLHQEKGKTIGHSIAIAVNAVKKMCATGDVNWPGAQNVNAKSRAEACAAVASWERKKAGARVSKGELGRKWSDTEFIEFLTGESVESIEKCGSKDPDCGCSPAKKRRKKREEESVSKAGNPFWDGDGLNGVGQPRGANGRWVGLPGASKFARIGVWEMDDGSFGVFAAEKGKKPRTPIKTFATERAAKKFAAKEFEKDKGRTAAGERPPAPSRVDLAENRKKARAAARRGAPDKTRVTSAQPSMGRGVKARKNPGIGASGAFFRSGQPERKNQSMADHNQKKREGHASNLVQQQRARIQAVIAGKGTPAENKIYERMSKSNDKGAKFRIGSKEISFMEALAIVLGGGRVEVSKSLTKALSDEEFNALVEEVDTFFDPDNPDTQEFEVEGEIEKRDDEKQMVFGWCSIAKDKDGNEIVDKQGDVLDDIDQMENVAYDFVLHSRDGGEMHVRKGVSTLVESFVSTPEKWAAMGIPEGTLPVGWWVGFKVNDKRVWNDVKIGKYRMFSVHGSGTRKAYEE